jgi:hypothetical protein
MCKVCITNWSGRYGNNIMQIAHACKYAFEDNNACILTFPSHINLKSNEIKSTSQYPCECNKIIEKVFFYGSGMNWIGRRKMIQKYVLNILPDDLLKYTDTIQYDCCVHLRSGDTVGVKKLQYMQLKTEYYFNAIDNVLKDNLTVNIVYEDKKLDTFFLLEERYKINPLVTFSSSTNMKDINTLIRCEHLILSVGTYGMMAYCMSKHIKHIYISKDRLDKLDIHNDPNITLHVL